MKQKSVQDIASLFGQPNSTLGEIRTTDSTDGDNVSQNSVCMQGIPEQQFEHFNLIAAYMDQLKSFVKATSEPLFSHFRYNGKNDDTLTSLCYAKWKEVIMFFDEIVP